MRESHHLGRRLPATPSREWLTGKRVTLQLAVGVPLGMIAASTAGLTQIGISLYSNRTHSWEEALATVWPGQPIGMALQVLAAIGVMWIVIVKIAGRPLFEFSQHRALTEVLAGVGIGAAVIVTTVLILGALGSYTVVRVTLGMGLVSGLMLGLGSAFAEEVLLRGILLRLMDAKAGPVLGICATSLLFGLLHLGNPHASLFGALSIAMHAGVLFGLAYLLTRRLWLVIGLHGSWNFVQSAVFGISVSGVPVEPGLLISEMRGPDWLSGGDLGLEGSLITLLISTAASMVLLALLLLRRRRKAPADSAAASDDVVQLDPLSHHPNEDTSDRQAPPG